MSMSIPEEMLPARLPLNQRDVNVQNKTNESRQCKAIKILRLVIINSLSYVSITRALMTRMYWPGLCFDTVQMSLPTH